MRLSANFRARAPLLLASLLSIQIGVLLLLQFGSTGSAAVPTAPRFVEVGDHLPHEELRGIHASGGGSLATLVTLAEDCPFSQPAVDSMRGWSKTDLQNIVVVLPDKDKRSQIASMAQSIGLRTVFVSPASDPSTKDRLFARTPWQFVVDSSGKVVTEGSWSATRK